MKKDKGALVLFHAQLGPFQVTMARFYGAAQARKCVFQLVYFSGHGGFLVFFSGFLSTTIDRVEYTCLGIKLSFSLCVYTSMLVSLSLVPCVFVNLNVFYILYSVVPVCPPRRARAAIRIRASRARAPCSNSARPRACDAAA